ncbi:MAG: hypothetical protein GYA33_11945 [Thermogutta sp.]|nr:hypothetical protein [Thermogutta sp.]
MMRAFFLAVGLFVVFLGVQTLGVQRFTLKARESTPAVTAAGEAAPAPRRVLEPKPWVPWSLMSSGAVVSLYAVTWSLGRK